VPHPVDALLNLVDELHLAVRDDEAATIDVARGNIVMAARDLFAAGVAEGRANLDEATKLAAVHAYELGVTEGRRDVYDKEVAAYNKGFNAGCLGDKDQPFALGVAEGRRQAVGRLVGEFQAEATEHRRRYSASRHEGDPAGDLRALHVAVGLESARNMAQRRLLADGPWTPVEAPGEPRG
jgi:hypothetical protein